MTPVDDRMPAGHWNLVNPVLSIISRGKSIWNWLHITNEGWTFLNIIFVLRMNVNYDHKAATYRSFAVKSS